MKRAKTWVVARAFYEAPGGAVASTTVVLAGEDAAQLERALKDWRHDQKGVGLASGWVCVSACVRRGESEEPGTRIGELGDDVWTAVLDVHGFFAERGGDA